MHFWRTLGNANFSELAHTLTHGGNTDVSFDLSSKGAPVCNSCSSVLVPNRTSPSLLHTFVVDILLNFHCHSIYLHQHIPRSRLRASSCLLLDSPNVHPQFKKKKNQRKMANFNLTVNDVFRYSLNTDNLGWILTLQVRQQAKKAPDHAWSTCALATRKEKLLNLNYFFFLLWWRSLWFLSCRSFIGGTIPVLYDFKKFSYTLYGYFYTKPVCFYQKSWKPCHWSHNLCDRSGIFEEHNDSLQWIILILLHQLFSLRWCETSTNIGVPFWCTNIRTIWPPEINKNIWSSFFFYKRSFFSLEN